MIFLGIITIVGLAYAIYVAGKEIYSKFDHSFIPSTPLYLDAKIVDISSESVMYVKNGAKYKTKITFSDGFVFTTHRTNRENRFLRYYISIDNELAIEIVKRAISAHTRAYTKQNS